MSSLPKKHHHLSRFVLGYFVGKDPAGMVWTYDEHDAKGDSPRPSLPEQTAAQTHLHTVFDDEGKPNVAIEKWLATVESKAERVYAELHDGRIPTGTERLDLALFLATLYARSPAMRRVYGEWLGANIEMKMNVIAGTKERFEKVYRRYEKEIGREGVADVDALYEFMTDKSRYRLQVDLQATLRALELSEHLIGIFRDMSWAVLSTPPERPFVTGDFPVVRVVDPETCHQVYGDGGFMNKTAIVSVPLSPTRLLQMTWDHSDAVKVIPIQRELVKMFNRQRAYFAERFLYADRRDEGIRRLAVKNKDNRVRFEFQGSVEIAPIEVKRKLTK